MKKFILLLLVFILSACSASAPLTATEAPVTPTTAPTSTLTPTESPTETPEPTATATEQVELIVDRPLEIEQSAVRTVEDVTLTNGVVISKVSFGADKSAAKIITGFPMSERDTAKIGGLKLAAIAHWYFGPVKHNPRTEPMPEEYEAEFAKLWAEVQQGGDAGEISVEMYGWDANDKTQTEPKPFKVVFFPGKGKVPEDAIVINAVEYVYTNAAKDVNLNASNPSEIAEIIGFPRMDKTTDPANGYEIELDGEVLRVKIEYGTFTLKNNDLRAEILLTTFYQKWFPNSGRLDQKNIRHIDSGPLWKEGFKITVKK